MTTRYKLLITTLLFLLNACGHEKTTVEELSKALEARGIKLQFEKEGSASKIASSLVTNMVFKEIKPVEIADGKTKNGTHVTFYLFESIEDSKRAQIRAEMKGNVPQVMRNTVGEKQYVRIKNALVSIHYWTEQKVEGETAIVVLRDLQ